MSIAKMCSYLILSLCLVALVAILQFNTNQFAAAGSELVNYEYLEQVGLPSGKELEEKYYKEIYERLTHCSAYKMERPDDMLEIFRQQVQNEKKRDLFDLLVRLADTKPQCTKNLVELLYSILGLARKHETLINYVNYIKQFGSTMFDLCAKNHEIDAGTEKYLNDHGTENNFDHFLEASCGLRLGKLSDKQLLEEAKKFSLATSPFNAAGVIRLAKFHLETKYLEGIKEKKCSLITGFISKICGELSELDLDFKVFNLAHALGQDITTRYTDRFRKLLQYKRICVEYRTKQSEIEKRIRKKVRYILLAFT